MRIDPTTGGLGQTATASASRAGRSGGSATPAQEPANGSAAVDRAQFSFDQTRIRSLTEQALSAPEVRQEKVSSLAQAVGSGAYTVDARNVASAIIAAYRGAAL